MQKGTSRFNAKGALIILENLRKCSSLNSVFLNIPAKTCSFAKIFPPQTLICSFCPIKYKNKTVFQNLQPASFLLSQAKRYILGFQHSRSVLRNFGFCLVVLKCSKIYVKLYCLLWGLIALIRLSKNSHLFYIYKTKMWKMRLKVVSIVSIEVSNLLLLSFTEWLAFLNVFAC